MNPYFNIVEEKHSTFNLLLFFKNNKIKLEKKNNFNNVDIEISPFLVKYKDKNDVEILKEKAKNFLMVMHKDCKNFDASIFLKNFKKTLFDLKQIEEDLIKGVNGSVVIGPIRNLKLKNFKVVYHEFFHLSSLKKNEILSLGVDEGYTQLLEERYFNKITGKIYNFEVFILKYIEYILGQDCLEKLYFSGNFDKLFKEINKYISYKEVLNLYENINNIHLLQKEKDFKNKEILLQKYITEAFEILFNFYLEKNNNNLENINKEFWCSKITVLIDNEDVVFSSLDETKFNEMVSKYSKHK